MRSTILWLMLLVAVAHFAGCQSFNSLMSSITNRNTAGPSETQRQQQRPQYQYD